MIWFVEWFQRGHLPGFVVGILNDMAADISASDAPSFAAQSLLIFINFSIASAFGEIVCFIEKMTKKFKEN